MYKCRSEERTKNRCLRARKMCWILFSWVGSYPILVLYGFKNNGRGSLPSSKHWLKKFLALFMTSNYVDELFCQCCLDVSPQVSKIFVWDCRYPQESRQWKWGLLNISSQFPADRFGKQNSRTPLSVQNPSVIWKNVSTMRSF